MYNILISDFLLKYLFNTSKLHTIVIIINKIIFKTIIFINNDYYVYLII